SSIGTTGSSITAFASIAFLSVSAGAGLDRDDALCMLCAVVGIGGRREGEMVEANSFRVGATTNPCGRRPWEHEVPWNRTRPSVRRLKACEASISA
ncbi:hypothetical protein EDB19DRAFT_1716531, partial [Suillus lakei]